MGFLRRLFGGDGAEAPAAPGGEAAAVLADAATIDEEERARELELARFDQGVSELVRRQQRYAERSWTPPAEGGDRRADDEDSGAG